MVVEDHPCSVLSLTSKQHLSPLIASKNGCGTRSQPWILQADPGQRINITLLNFSSPPRKEETGFSGGETPCLPVGYIVEPSVRKNVSICAGPDRQVLLYQTETNVVEVVLGPGLRQGPSRNNFLAGFQGRKKSNLIESKLLESDLLESNPTTYIAPISHSI